MIKVVAKSHIKVEELLEAIALSKELIEHTRKDSGCIKYELHQDTTDKSILTMIEEWRSDEDLEMHLKDPKVLNLLEKISPLLENETEMNIYRVLI